MRGGRFEPFYCNDEYFCHWIQWQHLGKTPAVVHGTKFSLKNLLFNTSWISIRLLNQWWLVVSSIPTGGIFIFYWNLLKLLNAYLYRNVKFVLFAKTSIDSMNAGKSSQLGKNGFRFIAQPNWGMLVLWARPASTLTSCHKWSWLNFPLFIASWKWSVDRINWILTILPISSLETTKKNTEKIRTIIISCISSKNIHHCGVIYKQVNICTYSVSGNRKHNTLNKVTQTWHLLSLFFFCIIWFPH